MQYPLLLLAFLLGSTVAVDYATVQFCGKFDEGIRRVYQASTSVCHDGTYYVKCASDYNSVSLYTCDSNLISTFPIGECTDGSVVWPGKTVFINCDPTFPSVPNGFVASTIFPVDSDCTSDLYPLSSFRYPASCQSSALSNYSTLFCHPNGDMVQPNVCNGACTNCVATGAFMPVQQCNKQSHFPSQVYSCGDVNIQTPQTSPVASPLTSNQEQINVRFSVVALFTLVVLFAM